MGFARNPAGTQRDPDRRIVGQNDLEGIGAGARERDIEDQDGPRLDLGDSGGRFAELDIAFATHQFLMLVVDEPDPQRMGADFGPPSAHPDNQVGPRMHGGKLVDPDVLENAQHGQLAVLVDQGVVGDDSQVDVQGQATRIVVTTSPWRMALTTSMPEVTWPKTVWTPSRWRCGP